LKILNDCIRVSEDKQLIKFLSQKILHINYIFYILSQKDFFTDDSPKAFLNTILKKELYFFLNEVWLHTDTPTSYLFDNEFVVRFI